MTATTNAKTAALEALIEAHAIELKLPTVRRRYLALAAEATRRSERLPLPVDVGEAIVADQAGRVMPLSRSTSPEAWRCSSWRRTRPNELAAGRAPQA